MTELVLSLVAGLGVFYLYSAYAFGWRQLALAPHGPRDSRRHARQLDDWLAQAGLEDINVGQFVAVSAGLFAMGGAVAFSMFGGVVPALLAAAAAASIPAAAYRVRRRKRRDRAHEAWPRMIEEMRVLTGAAGRSIPQAWTAAHRRKSAVRSAPGRSRSPRSSRSGAFHAAARLR